MHSDKITDKSRENEISRDSRTEIIKSWSERKVVRR